jgi:hypothetical protein
MVKGRAFVATLGLGMTGLVPVALAPPAQASSVAASVHVYPSPGTSTISPTQEISFRGVSASALPTLKVTGSVTGTHAGRWVAQSDGEGATWEPSTHFRAGEQVTVTSSVAVSGTNGHDFTYTVARPAPVSPQQVDAVVNAADTPPPTPAAPNAATPHTTTASTAQTPNAITACPTGFPTSATCDYTQLAAPSASPPPLITRPDLQPPAITTTLTGTSTPGPPGVLLSTPVGALGSPAGTQSGEEISDNDGQPIWFNPSPNTALDLQMINYLGRPALAYHQNLNPCGVCSTTGYWVVLDNHYNQIATINPDDGYQADGHALEISPDGNKALLLAYNPVVVDDSANGGPPDLQVLEGVIQEIDLRTGVMDFEWHSLGSGSDGKQYVPLSDSYVSPTAAPPYDYIHLNSAVYVSNDTILFTARHTSTVYKLSLATGLTQWRLGGTRNQFTFTDGDGGPSFAHDAQVVSGSGDAVTQVSVYDNGVTRSPNYSRGVVFNLDETNLKASVANQWRHVPDLYGFVVGSNRLQAGGDRVISFGSTGYTDEFDSAGNVVWASQMELVGGDQVFTYRNLRAVWHATPQAPPVIVVNRTSPTTASVTSSWNGATDITGWQLFAGPDAGHLSAVSGVVPKTAFETSVNATVPAADSVFQMRAYQSINGVTTTGYSHTTGDAIATHYQALGGPSSFLGTPVGGETTIGSGLVQAYQGGNIYWSAATGAWSVRGNILAEYTNVMGGPTGALGFPTSDEQQVGPPDGRYNTFQVGNIYFSNATNAHEVQGLIMAHYAQLGGATGVLGFPTADEAASGPAGSGGRFSQFQVGNMYWTPPTGAHEVQGVILGHYLQLGGPSGVLGFPTSDETASPAGGRMNTFQVGDIFFSPGTGAFEVQGAILARYNSMGGPGSFLGFPTSDEFTPSPGFRQSNFQFGHYILFSWANGSTTVH